MLCGAPFGYSVRSVFDLGVGTYRGPSVVEHIICAVIAAAV